jgi:hypothetical protein
MQSAEGVNDPKTAAKGGLTRRQMLGMGVALGAGVVLGLASCERHSPPATALGGGTLPESTATGTAAAQTGSAPASSQSASTQNDNAGSRPTTEEANAATESAPDLGAEVFPDAQGRALAQIEEAPVIIVPRADWTAVRPRLKQIVAMGGITRLTVHHTAGQMETAAWKITANVLEGIRGFHAGSKSTDRNWADIAYHFAIDRAGRVWQARPLAYQGAHVYQHNKHNLGIVLLGNFEVQNPTSAQLVALRDFIGFVRKIYNIPLDRIYTHRELGDSECPGRFLQEYMVRARGDWGEAEGAAWKPAASKPAPD